MVEIIKKGELPGEKVYTGTCSYCKCVFKFKGKEAKFHSDQRDGDFYQLQCPTPGCVKMVSVDAARYEREKPAGTPPLGTGAKDPLKGYGGHYGY